MDYKGRLPSMTPQWLQPFDHYATTWLHFIVLGPRRFWEVLRKHPARYLDPGAFLVVGALITALVTLLPSANEPANALAALNQLLIPTALSILLNFLLALVIAHTLVRAAARRYSIRRSLMAWSYSSSLLVVAAGLVVVYQHYAPQVSDTSAYWIPILLILILEYSYIITAVFAFNNTSLKRLFPFRFIRSIPVITIILGLLLGMLYTYTILPMGVYDKAGRALFNCRLSDPPLLRIGTRSPHGGSTDWATIGDIHPDDAVFLLITVVNSSQTVTLSGVSASLVTDRCPSNVIDMTATVEARNSVRSLSGKVQLISSDASDLCFSVEKVDWFVDQNFYGEPVPLPVKSRILNGLPITLGDLPGGERADIRFSLFRENCEDQRNTINLRDLGTEPNSQASDCARPNSRTKRARYAFNASNDYPLREEAVERYSTHGESE